MFIKIIGKLVWCVSVQENKNISIASCYFHFYHKGVVKIADLLGAEVLCNQ
jgi:hypothetical protein